MKQIRTIALLLCILLLAGCSAAKNDVGFDAPAATNGGNGVYDSADKESTTVVEPGRKLIRTVDIHAETENLDRILSDLDAKLSLVGGYVQNKSVRNSGSNRSANLTLRIPADKLDDFVDHIEGATNILSFNEKAEDITLKYSATESRIKALETQEQRLLELIAKAATLNDLLTLEAKLANVREELETVKSQLIVYDSLIDYSTVNLTVTEVIEYTVEEEPDPTAWERIRDGFVGSVKGVWHILSELFIGLVIALPYLVIPCGILLGLFLTHRKKKKKVAAVMAQIRAEKMAQDKEV